MLCYFFDSSDPKAWKFQKIELQNVFTSYIDNTDENVTKCYFYILSLPFPEPKKSGGELVLVISLPW